ncbi:MAG TPA: beta-propeller fold lactonase family protein [Polyangia bacterium]
MTLVRRAAAVGLFLALGCAGAQRRDGLGSGTGPATDAADGTGPVFVYVGMAGGEIALFYLDAVSGTLARRGTVSAGRAPSSLVRSVERESLIAVDGATGQAASFSIDPKTGGLRSLGRAATGGANPSGAALDDTGKYVIAAHPAAGRVSVLAVTQAGGLKAIGTFAAGAGAHAVAIHPAQIVFVANFRADSVSQYTFNTGTGMLVSWSGPAIALPPGSGPTRLVCHPSGRWVYLLEEGTDSVAVYGFDGDLKALSPISSQVISTLADGSAPSRSRPADLAVSPTGRFLFETNRGADDVATFAIEGAGTLKLIGHVPSGGRAPGALAVDPSGRALIVANEAGKSLSVYAIDPATGALGQRHSIALAASPLAVLAVRP